MMFRNACACLIVLLALSVRAAAAPVENPEWLLRDWMPEDGLPDARVNAIQQTTDGFLWVGTRKGLARFDGIQFKKIEPRLMPGSEGDPVSALLEDRRSALWIATGAGRLYRYQAGRFLTVEADAHTGPTEETTLAEDKDGGIWLLRADGDVLCYHLGTVLHQTTTNGLPPGKIGGLCADDAGRVWLVAGDALYQWSGDKWIASESAGRLNPQRTHLMAAARAGGVWAGSPAGSPANGGKIVRRFDRGDWHEQLEATPWTPNSMRSEVTTMLEDHAGRVWVGMLWNGIWSSTAEGAWQPLQHEGPLLECQITCLHEDRQGAIWVGTDREGLHCVSRRPVTTLKLPDESRDNIITTSCASRDGSIWLGTDGASAFRYRNGIFEPFGSGQGLGNPHVNSVFEDSHGTLWFGTWGGLYQFTDGGFTKATGLANPATTVLAIFEDHAGRIWAGTAGGLICRENGQWSEHPLLPSGPPPDIRALAEDSNGNLWVGTNNQGLFRLKEGRITQFMQGSGFPSKDADVLYCDAEGGVWIGTINHGVVWFQHDRFTSFTMENGLPCDTIGSISPDGLGNLWMGSDNGIFACPLAALKSYRPGISPDLLCLHLGLPEGLGSRACSGGGQPKVSRSNDGRFWFPNMRGLAVFDPRALKTDAPPRVLIDSVAVDGTESTPATDMQASSSSRRLEFHYTAPSLLTPQALRFRYKLEGMDTDWVDAKNQRVASYSQLPPGAYRFRAMAGSSDGQWHEAAAPLLLEIIPHFWERRWVQLLACILLVCAITGTILLNQRRKHRQRLARVEHARAMEQERQRIAANIHDDLGASLTRITLLSDLTRERAMAGGIGAEMEQIHTTSRNLTRSMDEVVWAIAPEHDTLESLVNYLGKVAQDLLSSAHVRCRLEIPALLPEFELSGHVRHNLLLAAKEALHNVVKHAAASEARVQASIESGWFNLVISDNGCGFSIEDPVARHRFPTADGRISGGRGLGSMVARLRESGGRCELSSHPGQGTEVRLSVPLDAAGGGGPKA